MSLGPWLWVIAGPNGAGKSTLAERELSQLPNINPDVEARRLNPREPGRAAVAGGRRAIEAVRAALGSGRSARARTLILPLQAFHPPGSDEAAQRGAPDSAALVATTAPPSRIAQAAASQPPAPSLS